MTIKIKTKVMKVGNSNVITLSNIIMENYGIKRGDELEIALVDEGLVILKPILPIEVRLKTKTTELSRSPVTIP